MPSYYAKNSLQSNRQMKVQKLSVPFVIVGSATSGNVSITCDEPGFTFFKTQGNDQITGALASGETATYTTGPTDSTGVFNILVKIQEPVNKIVSVHAHDLVIGTLQKCVRGSATGVTTGSGGGQSIMITCTCTQALNAANTMDACLELEYIVNDHS